MSSPHSQVSFPAPEELAIINDGLEELQMALSQLDTFLAVK